MQAQSTWVGPGSIFWLAEGTGDAIPVSTTCPPTDFSLFSGAGLPGEILKLNFSGNFVYYFDIY